MRETVIVVPCYNEARRLPVDAFTGSCDAHDWIRFVFVDDGSTDGTLALLQDLAGRHPLQVSLIELQPNGGKAEAVRRGMLQALKSGAAYAGYWDADLATPLEEIPGYCRVLDTLPECDVVFGSRVKLLGRTIERRAVRHYPGRIFATLASLTLQLPVYDTQCGAKLFRATPEVEALFADPFLASWIFDVEIAARLIAQRRGSDRPQAPRAIYELPLQTWRDVAGSKLKPRDTLRALWELVRIRWRYLR